MSNDRNDWLTKLLATIVFYAGIGAVAMVGMRAVEWLIPAPKKEVLVCIVDKADMTECISLDQVPERKRVML